jgi:hypothetical protein
MKILGVQVHICKRKEKLSRYIRPCLRVVTTILRYCYRITLKNTDANNTDPINSIDDSKT